MSSDNRNKKRTTAGVWMIIGVIVLVILLVIWLTVADFTGDTDVVAAIAPLLEPIY